MTQLLNWSQSQIGRGLIKVFAIAVFGWAVRALALFVHVFFVEGSMSPAHSLVAANEVLRLGSDLGFISLGAFLGASKLEEWQQHSKQALLGIVFLLVFLSGTAYFLFLIITNKAINLVLSSFSYGAAFAFTVVFGTATAVLAVHLTTTNKPIAG